MPAPWLAEHIESGTPFTTCKINHGVWEQWVTARDREASGEVDPVVVKPVFTFDPEFRAELETDLGDLPRAEDAFYFGVSHEAFFGHDRILGGLDVGRILDVMESVLPDGYVPFDGTSLKAATLTGEIERLWTAIRSTDVVVVGPESLASVETALEFDRFDHVVIDRTAAHETRTDLLGELLDRSWERPTTVLVQAGPLSVWLARRLHGKLGSTFFIDIGTTLDLWDPEGRVGAWERIFAEELRIIHGVDRMAPRRRQAQEALERLAPATPLPVDIGARETGPLAWVEDKPLDMAFLDAALAESRAKNHWSNFGPVSAVLEDTISAVLDLPDDRRVVSTSSGTTALHALVSLHHHDADRPLRWVTSSFGFPASVEGPLGGALVVDVDDRALLDLERLADLDLGSYDGVVLTNVFGLVDDISDYVEFCRDRSKVLISDSAAGLDWGRRVVGDGPLQEIVSFHHTKPWGMGEGGCAIVPADQELRFRSIINFGLMTDDDFGGLATNGKMSELAAAAILQRLRDLPYVAGRYSAQYRRVRKTAASLGYRILAPLPIADPGRVTPPCVPLLAPHPVSMADLDNDVVVLRKYYRPLSDDTPNARKLFRRIVNVPCHPGLESIPTERLRGVLAGILEKSRS